MAGALKNLPPWAKGTIAVIITASVVVGTVFAIKGIRKAVERSKGGTEPAQKEEVETAESELTTLNKTNATKQKLTNSQALAIANIIDSAMQNMGSDEQSIKDQFYKLSNDADFLAVQKAFGKRLIKSGTVVFVPDVRLTLIPALHSELSDYWINLINKILKAKNIKYRV
jgi:hypothetical protein